MSKKWIFIFFRNYPGVILSASFRAKDPPAVAEISEKYDSFGFN